jgi:hypothetical protein
VTILGKALDFLRFASTFFKRAVKNVWHITSSSALRRKNVFEIFCDAIHTFFAVQICTEYVFALIFGAV